jgi:hypothetical protein
MNKVLDETQGQYALAYIDDVIIFSKIYEEHIQHIQEIFDRLSAAGLKLKPSKCNFCMKKVKYLGHVLSAGDIQPDPDKVQAMQRLTIPRTVKQVRSFVGMASYYRRFIPNFSDRFQWDTECQNSFEHLKHALISSPILQHADLTKPYWLHTDASQFAVGAVLIQIFDDGEKVIQY